MEINEYISKIKSLKACEEAVIDAHNYKTSQELWADCKRGDWMLWLIGRLAGKSGSEKRKKLVLTASKCARLVLPYVKEGEMGPLSTIETGEQWARGENNVTLNDVKKAADAAYAAAYTAYTAVDDTEADAYAAAAAAAYTAFYATAADAAGAAAFAYASAAAVDTAVYSATRTKILAQCADIVRVDYPEVDDLWKDGGKC